MRVLLDLLCHLVGRDPLQFELVLGMDASLHAHLRSMFLLGLASTAEATIEPGDVSADGGARHAQALGNAALVAVAVANFQQQAGYPCQPEFSLDPPHVIVAAAAASAAADGVPVGARGLRND